MLLGDWGYAGKTGGERAGHAAWVRIKKKRRHREEEKSHCPPAAINTSKLASLL